MRMKTPPLSGEMDRMRVERAARERKEQASAEEAAMDAAVRKSIKLHGA